MIEKFIDRDFSDNVLKEHPLHQNQYAYQTGKSTETALHNVVTCNESATEHEEIALAAFLDIEGASHRTSFEITTQAADRHGTGPIICRWICSMLEGRNIIPTLFG
jgi:hypothetical protein